jgi:carbamoyl-phosphate synthase large subunit
VQGLSYIDPWFLYKIRDLVRLEDRFDGRTPSDDPGFLSDLREAKRCGISDRTLADRCGVKEGEIRELRWRNGIKPVYKMVDTCAAEFEAATPYFYSTYETEDEAKQQSAEIGPSGQPPEHLNTRTPEHPSAPTPNARPRAIVIGSGPIRIGQGIEFDYCTVHGVWALREAGYESIVINNNPETVSTDFDTSDRLYFEPLTVENVLAIIREEQPEGVIVQFGGQTAINLAQPLHEAGVRLLGTSFDGIDIAEDRDRFEQLLRDLGIPKPAGRAVRSIEAALQVADEIGYPVLVRPSYVLGGRAMEIVNSREDLLNYMQYVVEVSPDAPILIDRYVLGKEAEVDVIGDGVDCLIPGVMEHIERAGVHSGDSMAVFPPQSLSQAAVDRMCDYAIRVARALKVVGLMNIQFVVEGDEVSILEVNPRASRTVPYLSKITGVPMVQVATRCMLGEKLADMGYSTGLYAGGAERPVSHVSVKAPVFSFAKLTKVDVNLGPEMKSTGEIMGTDLDYPKALYKAMIASGVDVPRQGAIIATIADPDKPEALPLIRRYHELGYRIYATAGTARMLQENGIDAESANKIHEGGLTLVQLIQDGRVNLLINTVSRDKLSEREAAVLRRTAVENAVPCLTSLDTAAALLAALEARADGQEEDSRPHCLTIDEYCALPAEAAC